MRFSDWSADVCSSDLNHGFFNEFTLVLDSDARLVVRELADRNILGGVSLGRLYPEAPDIRNGLVIAVTETTTSEDVDALAQGLREILACACSRKADRRDRKSVVEGKSGTDRVDMGGRRRIKN